jgi:hypothetical protein
MDSLLTKGRLLRFTFVPGAADFSLATPAGKQLR